MTRVARTALADLEVALQMLDIEADPARFRVLWVGAVALTRAIGHILNKVDAQTSPQLARAITTRFREWKADPAQHAYFHEFVELERNMVLKEYGFGFLSDSTIVFQSGGGSDLYTNNLFCPVPDGMFAGHDCRYVLEESIAWWHRELDKIDRDAAA